MNDVYISRSAAVAVRELAGEIIIMSAVDSTLFSLNESASVIWQAADGRTPLSEIVELRICSEFDVAPEENSYIASVHGGTVNLRLGNEQTPKVYDKENKNTRENYPYDRQQQSRNPGRHGTSPISSRLLLWRRERHPAPST